MYAEEVRLWEVGRDWLCTRYSGDNTRRGEGSSQDPPEEPDLALDTSFPTLDAKAAESSLLLSWLNGLQTTET